MSDHIELGKEGEERAAQFLINGGFKIKNRNWRFGKNEIDIIAEKENRLVIVEVKTRTNDYFENPKEAVTKKKQRFIIKAAEAYIEQFNINLETRFDIISILNQNGKIEIEHIEDAFQASLL
ncbi:MAG: YraN family protein [Bacteroidales bacterium]